ncbi:uncharacterized protein LOC143452218 isoform X1 [Clavelina lepadiformis]|uniref:uncharacterized protein LOC143452218 isoform X1 n=1 Tax=Clavelina lepadiformis TaxID=159417 RepID=UPI0040431509
MNSKNPLTLYDLGRKLIAIRLYENVLRKKSISSVNKFFYEFFTSKYLPEPVITDLVKVFILVVHKRIDIQDTSCCCLKECKTNRNGKDTMQASSYLKICKRTTCNMKFQKWSKEILRTCIHILMLTWTGRKFSPLSIIEDSPIPFGFLYTPRELLYKYVFEGFLVSNNIWKDNIWSIRVKRRSGEKEYLPPRHFRSWYIFPRLKNIIKERRERLDLDLERHHAGALSTAQTLNILLDTLCGFSPEYAKSQDSQTANFSTTAPSINLEMCSWDPCNYIFSLVLQQSIRFGFTVNTISIRFQHFCDVMETILQRLFFPTNVLQLLISATNPTEIFKQKDLLLQLSQLKKIEISYWWKVKFSIFETAFLWNDLFCKWPHLHSIQLSGVQMSFEQTNTDSCSANNLVYFPKSLLSLEIADGSVTADVLDWLSTCCQEICQSNPTKIFLRELTLSYETCLANDLNVWKSFLSLLDKSLMNLHKVTLNHCGLTDDQSKHLTDLVNSKECCNPFKSFIINQNELTLSNDTGCCCFFRI